MLAHHDSTTSMTVPTNINYLYTALYIINYDNEVRSKVLCPT